MSRRNPPDLSAVAALFADPSRARMIAALADGRSLAASVLARESGVAASTASEHLGRLVAGGVFTVEQSGRHRFYRLASAEVGAAVEALSAISPQPVVTSLRESTRAAAMRTARTCYDHLAGRLGVAVTGALIEQGALVRTDGLCGQVRGPGDRLSAPVHDHPYELGPSAAELLVRLGVDLPALLARPASARPLLRFCMDWSEQCHHLSGALGAAVLSSAIGAGWVEPRPGGRAVTLTVAGHHALHERLSIDLAPAA